MSQHHGGYSSRKRMVCLNCSDLTVQPAAFYFVDEELPACDALEPHVGHLVIEVDSISCVHAECPPS